jgi:hypothetical protein
MTFIFRIWAQISGVWKRYTIFRLVHNTNALRFIVMRPSLVLLTKFFLKFILPFLIAVTNSLNMSLLSILSEFLFSMV